MIPNESESGFSEEVIMIYLRTEPDGWRSRHLAIKDHVIRQVGGETCISGKMVGKEGNWSDGRTCTLPMNNVLLIIEMGTLAQSQEEWRRRRNQCVKCGCDLSSPQGWRWLGGRRGSRRKRTSGKCSQCGHEQ